MLQCGLFMVCSSFRTYPSAPVQFSPEAIVCMSSSVPGTSSRPSSLIWRFTVLFPHFFPFISLHPGAFSGSSVCFQSGDTSFSDAHCALFVGSFWSCLAAHLCLGFSHRDHPAALSLPTPCHINSCKSKQKQSLTPQVARIGEY